MRIVSLLPSATEIVGALGATEQLAAVTFECDWPPEVVGLPVASSTEVPEGLDPAAIDAEVAARAEDAPLYRLHTEVFAEVDPDVILTQDLCRVCAVPSGDVGAALEALGCSADVVSLDPHGVDDILADIARVGAALGLEDRARALVAELRGRLGAVAAAVAGRPRPRVAVLEWVDPPFTSGHWIPEMVARAGGEPCFGESGVPSRRGTWEELAAAEPEVIVVAPCGYRLDGARQQAPSVARQAALAGTPALREGRVVAVDADWYVVRPGPRIVDGIELLAGILHPDRVPAPGPDRAVAVEP